MENQFVNTLPYISNPIEEFGDFKYVGWEEGIYPKFKGGTKESEITFFTGLVRDRGLRKIIDFGVGSGVRTSKLAVPGAFLGTLPNARVVEGLAYDRI